MSYVDKIQVQNVDYNLQDDGAVRYDSIQSLTAAQKTQSRENIDSASTEEIADVKSAIINGCLTADIKTALLQLASKVAYIDDNGQDYYDDLYAALYERFWTVTNTLTGCTTSNAAEQTLKGEAYAATIAASVGYKMTGASVSITMGGVDITSTAYSNGTINIPAVTGNLVINITAVAKTVSSISAVYTQTGTVYDTDSLDSIKADLVVTATYTDTSTETVPASSYTLSGSMTHGTQTITVSFGGKTTTFTVVISEHWSYSIGDFTKVTGPLGNNASATCGVALFRKVAPSVDYYRRSFVMKEGVTSIALTYDGSDNIESQTSDYYPIKVPIGATSFTVAVTPNTQFVQVLLRQLNEGVYSAYTAVGPTGYNESSITRTFEASDQNLWLFVSTKYNSAGSSYPTEPTGIDVTFS